MYIYQQVGIEITYVKQYYTWLVVPNYFNLKMNRYYKMVYIYK